MYVWILFAFFITSEYVPHFHFERSFAKFIFLLYRSDNFFSIFVLIHFAEFPLILINFAVVYTDRVWCNHQYLFIIKNKQLITFCTLEHLEKN